MLTKENFLQGIKRLQLFFTMPLSTEQLSAYYDKLKDDTTDKDFNLAIEKVIDNERFTPSMAAIKNYLPKKRELAY
jgi:hypothetical protein